MSLIDDSWIIDLNNCCQCVKTCNDFDVENLTYTLYDEKNKIVNHKDGYDILITENGIDWIKSQCQESEINLIYQPERLNLRDAEKSVCDSLNSDNTKNPRGNAEELPRLRN